MRTRGLFRCGRSRFLEQKILDFPKFIVCPHRQEGRGVSQCRHFVDKGEGVKFSQFYVDVFYVRTLTSLLKYSGDWINTGIGNRSKNNCLRSNLFLLCLYAVLPLCCYYKDPVSLIWRYKIHQLTRHCFSAIFTPYQDRCTDALYHLLEDTKTSDSKMRVLHVLSFVIERLGPLVSSCVNKLTSILPSLWQVSESHNMLRWDTLLIV